MTGTKNNSADTLAFLKNAKKDFGLAISGFSELEQVEFLSTGNIAIDHIMGGGFPKGRVIECFGDPSSGKSTSALQAAAALQQEIIGKGTEEYIVYFDYENTMDKKYAAALGLDMDHASFILAQPDTLEQGGNFAKHMAELGQTRLMIWDSVAEMTAENEMEADIGKVLVAAKARAMAQMLQKLNSVFYKNNCTSIFINHAKEEIPMGWNPTPGIKKITTPGGKALKFHASVRVQFSHVRHNKGQRYNPITNTNEDFVVSSDVRVKVVKNKVADPQKDCVVRVRYGKGFDNLWTAFNILTDHNLIRKGAGGYYYFDRDERLTSPDLPSTAEGKQYLRGDWTEFADEHPEWTAKLIEIATDTLKTSDGVSAKQQRGLVSGSVLDGEDE